MNPSDFETKVREVAKSHFNYLEEHEHHHAYCNGVSDGFIEGAQWSRTETIAEILGMLRSKDAPTEMHRPYPYNHAWADWLERQLKEGK